jgi:hypothetical protein
MARPSRQVKIARCVDGPVPLDEADGCVLPGRGSQRCRSVGVGVGAGAGAGGGVVAAVRGSASCSALSGSIKPEPKLSSRSPVPSRLALAVRIRRMSAGVSFGLRSSSSATMPLTSAAATDVPVELVGVLGRRHQDVDARRRHRDVFAAIGAGEGGRTIPIGQLFFGHDVGPGLIYQDANIKVTAIENTHFAFPQRTGRRKAQILFLSLRHPESRSRFHE